MPSRTGRAVRIALLAFISLILALLLAAFSVFFYFAYHAIQSGTPLRIFDVYPIAVTEDSPTQENEEFYFQQGDLLLAEVENNGTEIFFPLYVGNSLYAAEAVDGCFVLRYSSLSFPVEGRKVLGKIPFLGYLVPRLLSIDRLVILLILLLSAAVALEIVSCFLLLKRQNRPSKKRKKEKGQPPVSELDKYASLDYNPFPQKLYSSKVETVEIEDYQKEFPKDAAALKIGDLPSRIFPLTEETNFSTEYQGYIITLTIQSK